MTESSDPELTPERRAVLLVEYQATQASAQHHDQLVWTVTSIVWAGNLVLMGSIAGNHTGCWGLGVNLGLCLLGVLLIVFVWCSQRQFRSLKQQKYEHCRAIERQLGMNHHTAVNHPRGSQTRFYGWISAAFLALWLLLAIATIVECIRCTG
jgi:hypothetical protein